MIGNIKTREVDRARIDLTKIEVITKEDYNKLAQIFFKANKFFDWNEAGEEFDYSIDDVIKNLKMVEGNKYVLNNGAVLINRMEQYFFVKRAFKYKGQLYFQCSRATDRFSMERLEKSLHFYQVDL